MTIFKNLPGEGRESYYLINNRVFVGAEEVLNVESGDGYTTLQTYLMPLNGIFTKGKNVMLFCIFYHNF